MNCGVIYFNKGEACLLKLAVSVHTLRRFWKGPVTLLQEGDLQEWIIKFLSRKDVRIKKIDDNIPIEYKNHPPFVRKSQLINHTPYELSLFMDSDTCVVGNIDEYFTFIEKYNFCTGSFASWGINAVIKKRILEISPLCKEKISAAIEYGKATNVGVMGFNKSSLFKSNFWKEWEQLSIDIWENKLSKWPEEVAAQVLIPFHTHFLMSDKWNIPAKYGGDADPSTDARIVHYCGNRHAESDPLCFIWKQAFWELYHSYEYSDFKDNIKYGTKTKKYILKIPNDITVVISVEKYNIEKLIKYFPLYVKTFGIMEYKIAIFIDNTIDINDSKFSSIKNRCKLIPWEFRSSSIGREIDLSAFVLGVEKHIDTPYFIRLDINFCPVNNIEGNRFFEIKFPEGYKKNTSFFSMNKQLNLIECSDFLEKWWNELITYNNADDCKNHVSLPKETMMEMMKYYLDRRNKK